MTGAGPGGEADGLSVAVDPLRLGGVGASQWRSRGQEAYLHGRGVSMS